MQTQRLARTLTLLDSGMLLLLWLLVCWLVGVHGEFPTNDDWSYAVPVQRLLEEGCYRPTDWTSMPLLTHVLWGALFCWPNGFSHEALRLSTLVMAYLGLVATLGLLREVGAGRKASLLAVLLLGCNPMYVALSFTYMTDLPFVTLTMSALWLFARSLRTNSRRAAMFATVIMVAAILNRQLGLFVGLGYAVALVRRDGLAIRTIAHALAPTVIGVAALLTFEACMRAGGVMPAEYTVKSQNLIKSLTQPKQLLRSVTEGTFLAFAYLGWFSLPLMLLTRGRRNRPATVLGWLVTAMMAIALWQAERLMPLSFNIIGQAGIGPDTLRDVYLLQAPNQEPLGAWFWLAVSTIAVIGGGYLATRLVIDLLIVAQDPRSPAVAVRTMLFVGAAAYCTPILTQTYLDRYLILFVPILFALLLMPDGRAQPPQNVTGNKLAAAVACLPLAVLAIAGTHDWMERSRARWQALTWLEDEQGVGSTRIDGGFEYNGKRNYDHDYERTPNKSWWWVHDDEYVIAMGPLLGYRIVREYAINGWLPKAPDKIVVLQRLK